MINEELLEQTLAEALKTGGEFAEVFVEDKQSSSAYFDDGKVEELNSDCVSHRLTQGNKLTFFVLNTLYPGIFRF